MPISVRTFHLVVGCFAAFLVAFGWVLPAMAEDGATVVLTPLIDSLLDPNAARARSQAKKKRKSAKNARRKGRKK